MTHVKISYMYDCFVNIYIFLVRKITRIAQSENNISAIATVEGVAN